MSSFEGLKRAVLRIDNDYWKCYQEEKNKLQVVHTLQNHLPRTSQTEPNNSLNPPERLTYPDQWSCNRSKPPNPTPLPSHPNYPQLPSSNILGPNGCLTTVERQYCLSLGLCMHCGQTDHLARSCPRQLQKPPGLIEGCAAHLETMFIEPEHQKKDPAVPSLPQEPTA